MCEIKRDQIRIVYDNQYVLYLTLCHGREKKRYIDFD